jgi:hypothetical protein
VRTRELPASVRPPDWPAPLRGANQSFDLTFCPVNRVARTHYQGKKSVNSRVSPRGMNVNRKNVIIFYLAALFLSSSASALAAGVNNWTFKVENGVEKSKRSYLLVHFVYAPQRKEARRINVTSVCEKPYNAEGVYGKCNHDIFVSPIKKHFVLKTGEDVIMLRSPNQQLLLATLEYGCCGGPDTVRFYTEHGTYLGLLWGFHLRESTNDDNVITRLLDVRNVAEDYLAVNVEGGEGDFEVVNLESNKINKKMPISYTLKGKDACDYWHLGEFKKYGNRDFITLKVNGFHCRKEVMEEQEFSCTKTAEEIRCKPVQPAN